MEEVIDWMVASDVRQWQGVMDLLEKRRLQHADRIVDAWPACSSTTGPPAGGRGASPQRAVEPTTTTRSRAGWRSRCRSRSRHGRPAGGRARPRHHRHHAGHHGHGRHHRAPGRGRVLRRRPARPAGQARTAKNELRAKVEAMRRRLMEALTAQFDHELTHSLARIREAVSPSTRASCALSGAADRRGARTPAHPRRPGPDPDRAGLDDLHRGALFKLESLAALEGDPAAIRLMSGVSP